MRFRSLPDQAVWRLVLIFLPAVVVFVATLPGYAQQNPVPLISGLVTDRSTGQPLAGVGVMDLMQNASLPLTMTDANGTYSLTGEQLRNAAMGYLRFRASGYFSSQAAFDLASGPMIINVSLVPGGVILEGTVRDSATQAPIAGARFGVFAYAAVGAAAEATTDIQGHYVFQSSQFWDSAAQGFTTDYPYINFLIASGYIDLTVPRFTASLPFPYLQDLLMMSNGVMKDVTIETKPPGLGIEVDGQPYASPRSFTWQPSNPHVIATSTPQFLNGATGVRYVFSSWSDLGDISHTIVAPAVDTTLTAAFRPQFELTTAVSPANAGTVTSGWFDADAAVNVLATANTGYRFVSFSGSLSGDTNPQLLVMDSPKSVTAYFEYVNRPPVAEAGPDQQLILGEIARFDGSGSYDPDGSIVTYKWDFGDGGPYASGATVSHTYSSAGTYTATLVVTDDGGATATATVCVIVQTVSKSIQALASLVESFNLQSGIANSLDAKLQNVLDAYSALNAGNRQDAANKMDAFINAVEAQRNKSLTSEQADVLVNAAVRILGVL